MHKIRLITVGKLKTSWIQEGCSIFLKRLTHFCQLEIVILKAGTEKEEHARIAEAIDKSDGVVVLLDERGKEKSSKELSEWLAVKRDSSQTVTFVLGGAYGFSDEIRARAQLLALSRMTFPHELCQLIFLEQLYRAQSIVHGGGYHHE